MLYFFRGEFDLRFDALFFFLEGSWINAMILYLFGGKFDLHYDALFI